MRVLTTAALGAFAAVVLAAPNPVSVRPQSPPPPETNLCADPSLPLALGMAQWNGWGRDIANTRYNPEPGMRATDVSKLGLKWAFGFQGSAAAGQPTVVDGRLFVASATGRVYSLNAVSGCTYWTFDAGAGVRTAISIGEFAPPRNAAAPAPSAAPRSSAKSHKHKSSKQKPRERFTLTHLDIVKAPSAAVFGDDTGAVYALDAQKGTLLWKTQVDPSPLARIVGSPTIYHGRVYVGVASSEQSAAMDATYACCTFRGNVSALDMITGRVIWRTDLIAAQARPYKRGSAGAEALGPAGAAVSSAPTIDAKRDLLYVDTGGSLTEIAEPLTDAVVALDLNTGQVRWSRQFPRHKETGAADFGNSPILRTLADGRQILLASQKSGIVYALDPDRGGEVLWQTKVAEDAVPSGIEWGAAADYRKIYVALSGLVAEPDNGSGALAALDIRTGSRRWYTASPTPACSWGPEACSHAEAAAVTVFPGVAMSGSMDGHLRAYSTIDGKVVWDYDTAKDFPTINGIKASGGSLDQGGATIVNGVVYINSGYGQRNGQPGNVLLAFSVGGK